MFRSGRGIVLLVLLASSAVPGVGPQDTWVGAHRVTGFGDWMTESDQRAAWLGFAAAAAGDVDGDGYDDVVVGAYRWNEGGAKHQGRVWAFYGSATGLGTTADWIADGDRRGAYFGHSVGSAGDVNGDGYADLIVGAPTPARYGRAYVYQGSPAGLSETPNWTVELRQNGAWFGRTVRSAGDVNGDGYDDVIVGAPHFDGGQFDEGAAFVYLGSAQGLGATAAWSAESDQASSLFGRWVGTAGDVNGDGYDDVIVGAHFYDGDQSNEGRAFLYFGSPNGPRRTTSWTADGDQTNAWFARALSTAGDVNADGYDDVIIGAPGYDGDQVDEGMAFGFYGSAEGLGPAADWIVEADQAAAWFGRRLSTAGDLNADGYSDVIVGAPNYDTGQPEAGKVFVYFGSVEGLGTDPAWTAELGQAKAWFGRAVSTAGDVNADGYDDMIVGAPLYDDGQNDEGAAWLFEGPVAGLARLRHRPSR